MIGNHVYRKVSGVRIPASPPDTAERPRGRSAVSGGEAGIRTPRGREGPVGLHGRVRRRRTQPSRREATVSPASPPRSSLKALENQRFRKT